MEKHSSEPYNPNVAHVYYLAGFIESWGRGIEKICEACREDGVSLPEYDVTYTYVELAAKLQVSRKTVSLRIALLKRKGILTRIGSATKGYWQINNS